MWRKPRSTLFPYTTLFRSPVVVKGRQPADPYGAARVWRVQDPAVPDVDADVMDGAAAAGPEEDEVPGSQRPARHGAPRQRLVGGVPREHDADPLRGEVGQPRAVNAGGSHAAEDVGRPLVGARCADQRAAAAR